MIGKLSQIGKIGGLLLLGLSLSACVGTAYSGPVEITQFSRAQNAELAQTSLDRGPIVLSFPEEISNVRARDAFYDAVASKLVELGYAIALEGEAGIQTARITTSRSPLAPASSRGPVSVGVGGRTGSLGSGLGVGIGLDLGGNTSRPNALTQLSVRISDASGKSIWEGRAQQAISINSPYADPETSARALTAALFKGFPNGNGEVQTIALEDLQDQ